jgi:hypothetical protein
MPHSVIYIFIPVRVNWWTKNNITSDQNQGWPDSVVCVGDQLKVAYLFKSKILSPQFTAVVKWCCHFTI